MADRDEAYAAAERDVVRALETADLLELLPLEYRSWAIEIAVDAAAPLLIAAGRREAAEAIRDADCDWVAAEYGRTHVEGLAAAARIAEGDGR